jgi:hypothetical protein
MLGELLNPLMGMIVQLYLGRAVATQELARPTPKIARREGLPEMGTLEADSSAV